MATRDVDCWPVAIGTLRGVASEPEEMGGTMFGLLHVFPPLALLWELVEVMRGHRGRFLYTYQAGGNYHVGYVTRFFSSPGDPRLFGRRPGETLFIRYDPQNPGNSVVLAEDNPQ